MKKIVFALTMLVVCATAMAQTPKTVLDRTAAVISNPGGITATFKMTGGMGNASGTIAVKGKKFQASSPVATIWFNGKTMWTYVKANEEVNVTNPSADAVAKMNPYAFLSFYKKGYTVKMGKGTAKEHEVLLTGKSGSPYTNVVVRINKSTQYPTFIKMTSSKGAVTTIRCNSFLKNQKYKDSTFQFNKKNYPDAEIVDLR